MLSFDFLKNKFDAPVAIGGVILFLMACFFPEAVAWGLSHLPFIGEACATAIKGSDVVLNLRIFTAIIAISLTAGLCSNHLWIRWFMNQPGVTLDMRLITAPGDLNWLTSIVVGAALFGVWWLVATVGFHIGEAYYWHPVATIVATIIGGIGTIIAIIAMVRFVVWVRSMLWTWRHGGSFGFTFRWPWHRGRRP